MIKEDMSPVYEVLKLKLTYFGIVSFEAMAWRWMDEVIEITGLRLQHFVLGFDFKLHPVVLPLLSPLGRSLSLQVQLGPIEVLVEMSMTRWWFGRNAPAIA